MSFEKPNIPAKEKAPQKTSEITTQFQERAAEQPAWKRIEALRARSKFERSNEFSPATTITSAEGQTFSLNTVEKSDDPVLGEVQNLFERMFGEEEVDPEEIMRSAVEGHTPWDTPDAKYRIIPIKNENAETVGTIAGAPLDMLDAEGNPTGEMVYFVGYAVVDPSARQGGLAREAYISALIDAAEQAKQEGKKLTFAIGECTESSEHFWNSVGWKRIYTQKQGSAEYTEVPYIQPALEFDENTGAIAEDAEEVPEHLMIDSFGNAPTKEHIKQAYDALIRYCAEWPQEAFETEDALKRHETYIENLKNQFKQFLDTEGDLLLLDAEGREKSRSSGTKIQDHPST